MVKLSTGTEVKDKTLREIVKDVVMDIVHEDIDCFQDYAENILEGTDLYNHLFNVNLTNEEWEMVIEILRERVEDVIRAARFVMSKVYIELINDYEWSN